MTDLSGITVTPGILPPQQKEALATALDRIGGKLIDTVRIDTTHFVCTEGRGPLWQKAVEMNIPVVLPEWVDACEAEGTIVSVRGYYLNADPKTRQLGPIHGSSQHQHNASTASIATTAQNQAPSQNQTQTNLQTLPSRERGQSAASEQPLTPFPGQPTNGQPKAEEGEEESENEQSPPLPPPKDDAPEEEKLKEESPEPSSQPEQNGEFVPSETVSPDEKEELKEEKPEQNGATKGPENASPEAKSENEETTGDGDGEKKLKGKQSEGDFNEVPL